MPQVVPPKMLMTKPHYHVVPVCGVAQDRCRDPATARAGKQPGIGLRHGVQSPGHEVAGLFDDRHFSVWLQFSRAPHPPKPVAA